jgi:UV DNA damage endonuclease
LISSASTDSPAHPKVHLSRQNPDKRAGIHAYYIDATDWTVLTKALGGREADVIVEAKGKDQALSTAGGGIG